MNRTLRSILKITTSLLTVCMVILATCAAPALAATPTIYDPKDYFYSEKVQGDIRTIQFAFKVPPTISWNDPVTGEENVYTGHGRYFGELGAFSSFKLGVAPIGYNAVIRVDELKPNAFIGFRAGFLFHFNYTATSVAAGSAQYSVITRWDIGCYDIDGNLITDINNYVSSEFELPHTDEATTVTDYFMPLELPVDIVLPENCAGIAPFCSVNIVSLDDSEASWAFDSLSFYQDSFRLVIDSNIILEQSELIESIDGKLDTVIDGSAEMQDKVDDVMNSGQDLDEQLDAALEDLEELEDNSGQDLSVPIQSISDFLRDGSWFSIIDLIKPIMEFPPTATILTVLVAFINISILFFGR